MTANGTEISDGESLSGSQVVRVYGSNLTPPYFSLMFNGVEYTPLDYGEGYVEYVLQDNGTYEIRNEHDVVMSFEISGVTVPSELPRRMLMFQTDENASNPNPAYRQNVMDRESVNCINYNYKYNEAYQYFGYALWIVELDLSRLSFYNCSINKSTQLANRFACTLIVIDTSKPAYVQLDGFIVAVFNYTTTPQP